MGEEGRILDTDVYPVDVKGEGELVIALHICDFPPEEIRLRIQGRTYRLVEVTDGVETLYGYVEGQGHDGNMFVIVDKFQIGAICFVPLRFSATVP